MPGTIRCRCGYRVRVANGNTCARCPECLRTVRGLNPGLIVWAAGLVILGIVSVGAFAMILMRPPGLPAVVGKVDSRPELVLAKRVDPPAAPPKIDPPPPADPPRQADPPPVVPLQAAPEPVAQPPEFPRIARLQAEPVARFQVGDTFGQQVTVTRSSAFGIRGMVTSQVAEYTLTSTLEVTAVNADGSMVVTQTVLTGKLVSASADLKDDLAAALKKAVGVKFELVLGPTGKVADLKGIDDPLHVKLGRNAEQQTLRLWSVLDADAWKELAGLTYFQPDKPGLGEKWSRDFTHDWGPLGSWLGRTDYFTAKKPEANGQRRVDYAHVISHRPARASVNQPFAIRTSAFPKVAAGGAIRFDPQTNRVTAAEELFHVRGGVTAAFGGAEATVELEERQQFRLTVSAVKPRELVGRAPGK